MPIRFACACGKVFNVGDEHAGRRAKCAACGATNVVPTLDVEVVEEEEVMEAEVIEEKPARGRAYDDEEPRRKKKKRPPRERDGPMARMYLAEAQRNTKRDQAMARVAGVYDRDDDDHPGHGWTMFGIHITAGVLSGAGMLLFGLLMMALIAIFKDDEDIVIGPRAFIGAIVFTTLGAFVLVKALFFGAED